MCNNYTLSLSLSPDQVPALCLSCVVCVSAELWEGLVSTAHPASSFHQLSRTSSSTNDVFAMDFTMFQKGFYTMTVLYFYAGSHKIDIRGTR